MWVQSLHSRSGCWEMVPDFQYIQPRPDDLDCLQSLCKSRRAGSGVTCHRKSVHKVGNVETPSERLTSVSLDCTGWIKPWSRAGMFFSWRHRIRLPSSKDLIRLCPVSGVKRFQLLWKVLELLFGPPVLIPQDVLCQICGSYRTRPGAWPSRSDC